MSAESNGYPKVDGFDHVSDVDLVRRNARVSEDSARVILDRVGGLRHLATTAYQRLVEMPELGPEDANRIIAAVVMGRRNEEVEIDQQAFVSNNDGARFM